jgi:hypothetical protein
MIMVSVCIFAAGCGNAPRRDGSTPAAEGARSAGHHVRVEDLPRVEFVRVDQLPIAPPVATRRLLDEELTPELIRKASDLLRDGRSLGSECAFEVGKKTYVARFEWHYRYHAKPDHPDYWHHGITIYATD